MARTTPSTSLRVSIDHLIINSPCGEPARPWRDERQTRLFDLVEGRRPLQ